MVMAVDDKVLHSVTTRKIIKYVSVLPTSYAMSSGKQLTKCLQKRM